MYDYPTPRPQLKPKMRGSIGLMENIVRYNCRKHGFPVPVLAMPFWEGAGNIVYDLSGKRYNGTFINGVAWTMGLSGSAIYLDGSNDYVNFGDTGIVSKTITAWINRTSSERFKGIISNNTGNWHMLASGDYGRYNCNSYYNDLGQETISTYDDGNWHFVVALQESQEIYVDGVNVATQAGYNSFQSCDSTTQFGRRAGGYEFECELDNVCIFDDILTPIQIKYAYDNPYFMYEMPEELWGYAAAAAGFQAAWARNSNQMIGVYA